LPNFTSLTRAGTVFPVVVRTVTRGQPRSEHVVLATLRNTTFHACFPIPSAGSPGIAAGTLIRNWLAWHRAGAERRKAAEPEADVQADAWPAVSVAIATETIAAQSAERSGRAPRTIFRNTSGRLVTMACWQHGLTGGLTPMWPPATRPQLRSVRLRAGMAMLSAVYANADHQISPRGPSNSGADDGSRFTL